MPNVGGKKFPYTAAGMQMAKEESMQTGQPVVKEYMGGGPVHYSNGGKVIASPKHGKIKTKVTQGHKGSSKIVTWT
tara:strand:+ start:674 stop:901 length:228 start_codon:yes stop_codon:yes gene_type:complete